MAEQNRQSDIERSLREIRAAYAARLPQRLQEIADALQQCVDEPADAGRLKVLRGKLHGLAGSAGSFGYAELGLRATDLELLLNAYIEGTAPGGGDFVPIAGGVRQMLHWAAAQPAPDAQAAPGEAPPAAAAVPHAAPPMPVPAPAQLIYLVHDSPADDVASQLRHYGYQVTSVEPGELQAQIAARRPAALVFDLGFPAGILRGANQLADIRDAGHCGFPAIFISARSNFAARLASVRAGAGGYFSRPLDMVALVDRLDAMIHPREAAPHRVLVVDDDGEVADFYSTVLRGAGMEVRVLYQPDHLLQTLAEYRPELILLDVYMPECDGVELARLIRQDNLYLDVPIVFLSSEGNFDKQLNAIESGADGFLTKPIKPEQLISAINSRVRRYRDLRALIMRDGLTGLLNHSALKEQLARETARAVRNQMPLALAMLDIDHFKRVNDSYGHPVGDQVIRALSRLLQQRLRHGDIIGRYGGEEFVVIMPQTPAAAAARVIDEIRVSFENLLHHAEMQDFGASFSAGVAQLEAGGDADALLRSADQALYQAKHGGRNRVAKG